jgi:hypothetical protein
MKTTTATVPTVPVPITLVRLLLAEPGDFKHPEKHADTQALAKALLRTLVAAARVAPRKPISAAARKKMSDGMRKYWARKRVHAVK